MSMSEAGDGDRRSLKYAASDRPKRRATSRFAITLYVSVGLAVVALDAAAPHYARARAIVRDLTAFQLANIAEGVLWLFVGILVLGIYRSKAAAGVAVTLMLFGVSDWIEASTGAWWRPWWLLIIKAACVAVLLASLVIYFHKPRMEEAHKK